MKEGSTMIDFKNSSLFKLKKDGSCREKDIAALLIPGEEVISSYTAIRDYVVFTNKRVISVNVQGLTGKKKDFTSLPYAKVSVFSIETAGTFDLESELELYYSGVGRVRFEFRGSSDIVNIGRIISQYALR